MTHKATAWSAPVLAVVSAVLLAGCGALPGITEQYHHPPAEIADGYDCLVPYPGPGPVPPGKSGPQEEAPTAGRTASASPGSAASPDSPEFPESGSVPDGFTPVEVIRCSAFAAPAVVDKAGRWSTVKEERLSGDLEPLLRALSLPSERGGQMACPAIMEVLPELWLVDAAGQAVRPARPSTACGLSKPEAAEALDGLTVEQTVTHRIRLIEPRAALGAGCSNSSKAPLPGGTGLVPGATGLALRPEASIDEGIDDGAVQAVPSNPGLSPAPEDVDSTRVCLYSLDGPETPTPEPIPGGDGLFSGQAIIASATFTSVHTLDEEESRLLLKVAGAKPDAAKCEAVAPSFAVLWPLHSGQKAGAPITVELEECQRLIPADGAARNIPPDQLAVVAGDEGRES